jgi:hypothetical protein
MSSIASRARVAEILTAVADRLGARDARDPLEETGTEGIRSDVAAGRLGRDTHRDRWAPIAGDITSTPDGDVEP